MGLNVIENLSRHRRDQDGRLIIGNPDVGCRHCGDISIKVAENDKAVVYHPSLECCEAALKDQIRFRESEKLVLKNQIAELIERLDRLERDAEQYGTSRSSAASEANMRLERSRNPIAEQIQTLKGLGRATNDPNIVGIRQLDDEIARLTKKITFVQRAA